MTNEYGLDVNYFKEKLKLILRDVGNYTPDEMYRELTRLADVASPDKTYNPIQDKAQDILTKISQMYWNDEIFVVKNGEGFYTDEFVDLFVEF